MATVERYNELKNEVDKLRRIHDRAEGALEQAMRKLWDQCGCETLEEGRTMLAKVEKSCERKRAKFAAAMERFEEKWKEQLSE